MIPVCRPTVAVLCVLACALSVASMPPERSISTSRQFLVYGPDIRLRGAICDLAERTKHDLLQQIGQRDAWITPILIWARYPQANLPEMPRAALSFSQTGFGQKLQLDLMMASDVAQPEIRRELLRAVLLEMMYRNAPDVSAGTTYTPPPEWLLDGIQSHASGTSRALALPLTAHRVLSIEEIVRQRPISLDAPGRLLYCAYSSALVELLTERPDGRPRLARFIFDLPSARDDAVAHLRMHFPELIDATGSAQKVWLSHITRLSVGQSIQALSGKESERTLNENLSLGILNAGSKKRYQLDEFPMFIRGSSAKPVLVRLRRDLNTLIVRANPLYRPAIREYEKIAALLARGKTRGVAERLARLSASRRVLAAQMRKIDDYMNWFEATQASGPSGVFADYLKAADLADRPREKKRDPISVYLDMLETQFQN